MKKNHLIQQIFDLLRFLLRADVENMVFPKMFYLLLSLQIYFLVQEVSGSLQITLKCEFTLTYCALAIFCEQILAPQVSTCSKKSM